MAPPISKWLSMMPDTIQVRASTGLDEFRRRTYSAVTTPYRARIEQQTKKVVSATGEEKVSTKQVFLATTVPISHEDQIILPAPHVPSTPPIIAVQPVDDENGIHHVMVFC
jgi:hypothetical protein